MPKYNPFNQELSGVIDRLQQQVSQLRNDIESLSASAQRADDRFSSQPSYTTFLAVPVHLSSVDEREAFGEAAVVSFGVPWMKNFGQGFKAVNVLNNPEAPADVVFHNLDLESSDADIAIADPNTNSGAIFFVSLGANSKFGGGMTIADGFATEYTASQDKDGNVSWSVDGEEKEDSGNEGLVTRGLPARTQRRVLANPFGSSSAYNSPQEQRGSEGEGEDEDDEPVAEWKVYVYTYCKPDITVACKTDEDDPDKPEEPEEPTP
tara:strand:- start:2275 stop:3066 length:792 start_codon:yes stop_codon:yes gene_type:complete